MNIETERLIIKPLTLDDAKRFSEYRDKEEVVCPSISIKISPIS